MAKSPWTWVRGNPLWPSEPAKSAAAQLRMMVAGGEAGRAGPVTGAGVGALVAVRPREDGVATGADDVATADAGGGTGAPGPVEHAAAVISSAPQDNTRPQDPLMAGC